MKADEDTGLEKQVDETTKVHFDSAVDNKASVKNSDLKIRGEGPHTCIVCADSVINWFDGDTADVQIFFKPSVLHKHSLVTSSTTNDGERTPEDYEIVAWEVNVKDDDMAGEAVASLKEHWEDVCFGEKSEDWWFEVTFQRTKPEHERPAMKFSCGNHVRAPEEKGDWWVTGFARLEEQVKKIMEAIADDYLPSSF